GPRCHEGPARRESAARHDGHGHPYLPPREHHGQPDPRASLRRVQGCFGGASRVGHRAGSNRLAPPRESRCGHRRPDSNRGGAESRRPHRRGGSDAPARWDEGSRPGRRTRRRPAMNPGVLSVRNNRVVFVAMLLAVVGGIVAYLNIGRLEDPEFTIKQALIITPYPAASAEEVPHEVTTPTPTPSHHP